jgi:Protein of unknown function (DUF3592)
MPVRITNRIQVRSLATSSTRSRPKAIFFCAILLAGVAFLLWLNRGFALYGLTGLFWSETEGTVIHARNPSTPTIQFSTPDGALYSFSEDYILLCGGRSSFCFIRDFTLGQQVPVVYDPRKPDLAYVHDWALTATVITVFIEAGIGFLIILMLALLLINKPVRVSMNFDSNSDS